MMIQYIQNKNIDRIRWDECIRHSINRLPYAFSWWLDAVSPDWDALVSDQYDAVMPLPQNTKFGAYYLYQPFFSQQLGIFSKYKTDRQLTCQFLSAIPRQFLYMDIQMNTQNDPDSSTYSISYRKNQMLDLRLPYQNIYAHYHRNCRRNIQKAIYAGLDVRKGPQPTDFSRFIQHHLEKQIHGNRKSLFAVLQKLSQAVLQHETGEILGVYKPAGELVAAGLFVYDEQRCFFIACASTAEGREKQSMYLLVDYVIRQKAGSGAAFDFTGSNIKGVAYFNAGFGAIYSNYPVVKMNKLPFWMKLFKK